MRYYDEVIRNYPAMDNAWRAAMAILGPSDAQLDHGFALHRDAMALDTFGFLPMVWTDEVIRKRNLLADEDVGGREFHFRQTRMRQLAAAEDADGPGGAEYLAALQASGLDGMVQTVGAATVPGMNDLEADMAAISGFTWQCHRFRHRLFQAGSTDELREGKAACRFGIVWSANSPPLPGRMIDPDDELQRLTVWRQLGFRMCHLTYNRRNTVAEGGVEDADQDGGLSQFGRDVVSAFNEAGIIVDVPHSSRRTVLDAARITTRPMMSSHAGCRALFDHHRNRCDEELKAIASTDGLCGIVSLGSFLGTDASIQTLLDHVMHAVRLIGSRHVAIGTDRSAPVTVPTSLKPRSAGRFKSSWAGGWNPDQNARVDPAGDQSLAWTNWPLFTVGLVMRGLGDDDIRQILGLNLLRVMQANTYR